MPESFGARLRLRREGQQIALTTIAEETKIKLSLLEALERDDVSRWPSGIFRRAYIRAYAHAIGLPPDAVLREFLEVHPEPAELAETAAAIAAAADHSRSAGGPPSRLRNMVDSAIDSISRFRRGPAVEGPLTADSRPGGEETVFHANLPMTSCAAPAPQNQAALPLSHEPTDANQAIGTVGTSEASECAQATPASEEIPPQPFEALFEESVSATENPAPDVAESVEPDLLAVASLCTELGRVESAEQLPSLLNEAARLLDATGVIVWLWDAATEELRPALAYGYSDRVLAQLPRVQADADNVTAAAFRSAHTCAIEARGGESGALVVPLLTPGGCSGALALELEHGGEKKTAVHAVATILAALLAQLTGGGKAEQVSSTPLWSEEIGFVARA